MTNFSAEIRRRLLRLADEKYKAFQGALIPTVPQERIIGVRTPQLKALVREIWREGRAEELLVRPLPHATFDEMQLHAFVINSIRDFDVALAATDRLLPYVDNWATCDQLSPAVFKKHPEKLLSAIRRWMQSEHEYTVRFGIGMLMRYYLDAPRFQADFLELVLDLRREEYYIRMMQAWFFATALAKQYVATLPFVKARRLDAWTHRMTIRKACESLRLTSEQKAEIRAMR